MFLLLLTMPASHDEEIDWENLTNRELHDKFQRMMSDQVQDFVTTFREAMDKLEGMDKKFNTKMNAKFNEVLARLPAPAAASVPLQPQPQRLRARRVPVGQVQNFGVVATTAAALAAPPPTATTEVSMAEKNEDYDDDYDGDYDDEGEVAPVQHQEQQPRRQAAGRPHGYNRNGRDAPHPQVRDHDHLPKLKLNIPTFDG
ncbi:hypothetical protein ZWY2020_058784 [Hordeum vulgare]|nr:hypothetical protein ZWY2020_058784 [Hordeum vulgare]